MHRLETGPTVLKTFSMLRKYTIIAMLRSVKNSNGYEIEFKSRK